MKSSHYWGVDARDLSRVELRGAVEDYVSQLATATKVFHSRPGAVSYEAEVPGRNANSRLYMVGSIRVRKESPSLVERVFGWDSDLLASIWSMSRDDSPLLEPRIGIRDASLQRGLEASLHAIAHHYSSVFSRARLYDEL